MDESVGPYRIESLLGEGGMARVYKAVGPGGQEVALKLVNDELADQPVFRRRFDREGTIAARVENPYVVRVLDIGRHKGTPYMVQELIVGGSLDEKIAQTGPLKLEPTVTVCLQVATGLEALHDIGLIHRDLKPANILLDEQGTAKITDFGLVKDLDGTVLTTPGQAVGSMDYMAPEQIRGEEVTQLIDVYALGCVMYECLCGKPPFADHQGMQILWAHLQDDPPDPCAARSDVPEHFSEVVMSALHKEPDQRPQSAIAYARMIEEAASAT